MLVPAVPHVSSLPDHSVPLSRPAGWSAPIQALSTSGWSGINMGTDGNVYALLVSGSMLYAGGSFTRAGNCTSGCNNIARWDGSGWSALGGGTNGAVYALAINGSTLYAGGVFSGAGSCAGCNRIASWNGSSWSPLGTGMSGQEDEVDALLVSGGTLYAGGWFTDAGTCTTDCNYIASWNGSSWSGLAAGMDGIVDALAISGGKLYAGGSFSNAGDCIADCNNIAMWNGSAWSGLVGLGGVTGGTDGIVYALAASGNILYVGGFFSSAGNCTGDCNNIARWDGTSWLTLETGVNGNVYSLAVSGGTLVAGGLFSSAGACTSGCNSIAKWESSAWSPLESGMNDEVDALAASSSGEIYAGGAFSSAGACTVEYGCQYIAKYGPLTPNLRDLVLSSGGLIPKFATGTTQYSAYVNPSVTSLTVTPTAADPGTTIQVRINAGGWNTVTSGSPSPSLLLAMGDNPLEVMVTAADGTTTRTYMVMVTRMVMQTIYLPLVQKYLLSP